MNRVATPHLRDNWRFVELREVGQIVTGSTPSKAKTEYYGGSFPFVKPPELRHGPVNDAEDKLSDKGAEVADVAPIGSVLVSCIGNLGKTGRATQPVAFNQQINAIVPHEPNASKWIFYAVQTPDFASQLMSAASATTIAIVNKGKFSRLRIPLAPEDEQREIVAEIERQFTRLEAGVAGLRRVQANLKRYRAAVLKAACEGKLVPTEAELARERRKAKVAEASRLCSSGETRRRDASATISDIEVNAGVEEQSRDGSATLDDPGYETGAQLLERILTERQKKWNGKGKYKESVKPDTANLPLLPEGWAWAKVDQLLSEPLCNGISIKGSDTPPGIPALRLSAMSDNRFDYSDRRFLPLSESKVSSIWIKEGDFFVARGNGSLHLVGRGTPAQRPPYPIIFPDTMIRLRFSLSVRQTKWIPAIWPSRFVRSQIETRVKTTAGIYKIAQPEIQQIIVPLPPFVEQQRIVAEVERRLSVVEEIEAVVNANLQRATRLRQSILQRAFQGSLTDTKANQYDRSSEEFAIAADPASRYRR